MNPNRQNPNRGATPPQRQTRQFRGGQGRDMAQVDPWKQQAAAPLTPPPVYPGQQSTDSGRSAGYDPTLVKPAYVAPDETPKYAYDTMRSMLPPAAPADMGAIQSTPWGSSMTPPQPAQPAQNQIGGGAYGPQGAFAKGGKVKAFAKGGSVKSGRGDGIAQRGKTRGRMI